MSVAAMQFWTYLLTCADGWYYVGHTDDLEKRLAAHQDERVAPTGGSSFDKLTMSESHHLLAPQPSALSHQP